MTRVPYRLAEPETPRLGLIVLRVDETVETDFRNFFPPDSACLHVSRVASGDELTPDTIATMEAGLPIAAALLPPAAAFDVIGYACTSATSQIGAARVSALIRSAATTRAVTDPLTAALAAADALGLRRLGIVSPYTERVSAALVAAFEANGVTVPDSLSFGEEIESRVARIDPASTFDAACALSRRSRLDGLFLSCTNLRTLGIIDRLERDTGLPVLASNQVLAWHMAGLAGIPVAHPAGRLFSL